MKSSTLRTPFSLFAVIGLIFGPSLSHGQEELQDLYIKATTAAQQGQYQEALQTFDTIIQKFANPEEDFSWDDWGPMFGGVFYDKGLIHLQIGQYDQARECFEKCYNDYPNKIPHGSRTQKARKESTNMRWELALFQWGYAEQMLGNYQEGLDLYDQFIAAKPDPSVLRDVEASYVLRRGICMIGIGKYDEGEAEITRLFSEYDSFASRPSGQLLFISMLELAKGWIKKAEIDPDAAEVAAHEFLNKYSKTFSLSAYEKAQRGFIDQLRLTGFEANRAGLHSVALRFFSMVPTTQDIIEDLETRAAQTGASTRARYDELIASYKEKLNAPDTPELETLRLIANAWEGMGNQHAGYVINRYLAAGYPDSKASPNVLHEAARYAFNLGNGSAAQYFGEEFMARYPNHELRDNVSTFMLHALFRNQDYDTCVEVARNIRLNYEPGDPKRELADFIYGASLYSLAKHDEAQEALKLHIDEYPNSTNLEQSRFYYAFSKLSQQKYSEAAPLLDSFLKDYPTSNYKDNVLLERATCYFIASDDPVSTLNLCDQILEEFPESKIVDRAYILKGDAVAFLGNTPEEGKELKDYQQNAVDIYLQAKDASERLEHPDYRAEAIFKLVDTYNDLENWEESTKYYDMFFPDHVGHFFEPQISVFGMTALEHVDRAEDGLKQLERMIKELSDTDKVDLLAQCIGSYHDASIENRGHEATIAKYDEMIQGGNVTLQTWMLIHKIIAYQDLKTKEGADKAEIDGKIDAVFTKLKDFEIKDLSDIALQEIGKYLERTNPFQALPYFEELLIRDNKLFQAPAVMAMGRIESKSGDPAKVDNAIQRFKRVITEFSAPEYESKDLIPEAYLNLGRIGIVKKDWDLTREYLTTYINNKKWHASRKELRSEATHLYGIATMNLGMEANDPAKKNQLLDEATAIFNANIAAYMAYPQWSAQSAEQAFDLIFNRDWDPEVQRAKQIQAYSFIRRVLYSWQDIKVEDADALERLRLLPSRIEGELALSQEEINNIETELGIRQQ